MKAFPELAAALQIMLDRMDVSLRSGGYIGEPVKMYLAGGLAVNYYCGSRYTEDVDASFSQRWVLPKNLTVNYRRRDGTDAFIYFDHNYNTSFALLHDEYENDTTEWAGIGNERRKVQLRVLAPVDLAVSKIAPFSPRDYEDILTLAVEGLFTADEFLTRARDAMANFVGNKQPLISSIEIACREMGQRQRSGKPIDPR